MVRIFDYSEKNHIKQSGFYRLFMPIIGGDNFVEKLVDYYKGYYVILFYCQRRIWTY